MTDFARGAADRVCVSRILDFDAHVEPFVFAHSSEGAEILRVRLRDLTYAVPLTDQTDVADVFINVGHSLRRLASHAGGGGCKEDEGFVPLEPGPVSRTHASARVHLSDSLIRALATEAVRMVGRDVRGGKPRSLHEIAELVIRGTLGAINANADDRRNRDWDFEKRGLWLLTDEQAQMSFDRWKASASL